MASETKKEVCSKCFTLRSISTLDPLTKICIPCKKEIEKKVNQEGNKQRSIELKNKGWQVCPKCNFNKIVYGYQFYDVTHCLEVWCCVRCKAKGYGDIVEGSMEIESEWEVIIKFENKITKNELEAIRKLDKKTKEMPLSELKKNIDKSMCHKIGPLSHNELYEVQLKNRKFNLKLEIK